MRNTAETIAANVAYYDRQYSRIKHDAMVQKVSRWEETLRHLTSTRISWHGLYAGDLARRLAGRRVLELGCGDGLNALVMARLGADVTAIDISQHSEHAIRRVAHALGITNIHPLTGDFRMLTFEPGSFDFVIGKEFLHHLTHELEDAYLANACILLRPDGEARFCEPAVNSRALDAIRWVVPVPGRPSVLARRAFREWKAHDPHPVRANHSRHYAQNGARFFEQVSITPFGSVERLHRLLPERINHGFREWANGLERRLPMWWRWWAARAQLIVYRRPRGRSVNW